MCGRYTFSQSPSTIAAVFELAEAPDLPPRYNIAPTQNVATVRLADDSRHFNSLRWGLIPSWAKDASIGNRLINTRAETVAEKPSFRSAFKQRRCLILADGFYEWQRQEKRKQPFYFHLADGQPFAFAGLWEQWHHDTESIESCTIITTAANDLLRSVHDRMPVMLAPQDYDRWLDPQQPADRLLDLLRPYPDEAMEAYPVSPSVNNPKYDEAACIQPLTA